MVASLIIICASIISYINAGLFESLERQGESNAADCSKIGSEANCGLAGPCVWDVLAVPAVCKQDPCFKRLVPLVGSCDASQSGKTCAKVENSNFCVSSDRIPTEFDTADKKCKLEYGEYETTEKALCKAITGCGTVTPIAETGFSYYVCGPGTAPRDPCTGLDAVSCPFVGDCMLAEGICVTDECFERTYTSSDGCKNDTCTKTTFDSATPELGYCKTTGHAINHWCNVASSDTEIFLTPLRGTLGTNKAQCSFTVKINNFDGDSLYIANSQEGGGNKEFTAVYPDAAVSLNSYAIALLSAIVLLMMM